MSEPFIAEIKIVSFNFPPKGWAFCNGQVLQINQNQALFSLLGTTYGGDGRVTFGLPNLQGRMPVFGGLGSIILGERSGEEAHTLTINELPAHAHPILASGNIADQPSPANNYLPNDSVLIRYSNTPNASMSPAATSTAGGNQPHINMPPYLFLNFIIALVGIFPSRN